MPQKTDRSLKKISTKLNPAGESLEFNNDNESLLDVSIFNSIGQIMVQF